MSYAICRVQKIKGASSVHGVQIHQRREKGSNTNPDINYSRASENYSLIPIRKESFNKLADERIKEGYIGTKAIRKDAVKVVSALFTSDNEFFQKKPLREQKKFFDDCYTWACERFGKDNIISAVVHMDEQTPHLHIEFVPLTTDGRLSAYDVLGGRVQLQKMQDDFYNKIGKPWGLERGERADLEDPEVKKPRKHLETTALKQQMEAEVKKLKSEYEKTTEQHLEKLNYLRNTEEIIIRRQRLALSLENEIDVLLSRRKEVVIEDNNTEIEKYNRLVEMCEKYVLTAPAGERQTIHQIFLEEEDKRKKALLEQLDDEIQETKAQLKEENEKEPQKYYQRR
jgi:hypothetical protein